MAAKNTIVDKRKGDSNLTNGAEKAESPKLPENTPNVETLAPESEAMSHKPTFGDAAELPERAEPEGDPTLGRKEGAVGERALDPETDPPVAAPNPAIQPSDSTEDQTAPGARIMGEKAEENKDQILDLAEGGGAERALDSTPENSEAIADAQTEENQDSDPSSKDVAEHEVDEAVADELKTYRDEQAIQNNPDAFQKAIHQSTTEDVLAPPIRRPVTIDGMTGQVHYIGEAAALPGGTVAHEGDDPK